jgi:hypothetical protein
MFSHDLDGNRSAESSEGDFVLEVTVVEPSSRTSRAAHPASLANIYHRAVH